MSFCLTRYANLLIYRMRCLTLSHFVSGRYVNLLIYKVCCFGCLILSLLYRMSRETNEKYCSLVLRRPLMVSSAYRRTARQPPHSAITSFSASSSATSFFCFFSSSPRMMPQGCRLSTRSKMILSTAITGIERNMPEMPQNISPITTPSTVTRALIRTLNPQQGVE